jgi:hypothetical protein
MSEWQPIESAPKDGTEIDVWVAGEFPGRRTDVSWREPTDSEWWVHGGDTIKTPCATWHDCFGPLGKDEPVIYWMPLPKPPLCLMCNGRGEIGGFVNAESGYQTDICPACPPPPSDRENAP